MDQCTYWPQLRFLPPANFGRFNKLKNVQLCKFSLTFKIDFFLIFFMFTHQIY